MKKLFFLTAIILASVVADAESKKSPWLETYGNQKFKSVQLEGDTHHSCLPVDRDGNIMSSDDWGWRYCVSDFKSFNLNPKEDNIYECYAVDAQNNRLQDDGKSKGHCITEYKSFDFDKDGIFSCYALDKDGNQMYETPVENSKCN